MYSIDSRSAIPVYEQLKRQIRLRIVSGKLAEEKKLPSIRELATTLRINPNTVAKAYSHLETDGFVTSRKGLGFFVIAGRKNLQNDREIIFSDLTDEFISRLTELGFASEEIVKGLSDRLRGEIEHDKNE